MTPPGLPEGIRLAPPTLASDPNLIRERGCHDRPAIRHMTDLLSG